MDQESLSEEEEAFCRAFVFPEPDGSSTSLTDAYLSAFGGNDRRSAARRAGWLKRKIRIGERICALRLEAERVLGEHLRHAGIAQRAWRLLRKNRDWQRLSDLLAARASEASEVPGHDTGLLVGSPKVIGGEKVIVYRFDKAVLDALIDLEESAARELRRLSGKDEIEPGGQVMIFLHENGRDS